MKYFQRVPSIDDYFQYEYWWVTSPDINGPRLAKVRIPPKSGIASHIPWEFQIIDSRPDEPLRKEDERDDFIWLDYIQMPETSLYDRTSR